MNLLTEMLGYPFMVRAIIVGCLVSLCASLVGTSLVLKRYSMIGNGLSHVGFAALAVLMPFMHSLFPLRFPPALPPLFSCSRLKTAPASKATPP